MRKTYGITLEKLKGGIMSSNLELLNYLKTRRSVPLPFLGNPGPSESELEEILTIGTRVPDHKMLFPWRLIVYKGKARKKIGENLANIVRLKDPKADETRLEAEKKQFLPAPITIGVLSSPKAHEFVTEEEQLLSAGAVAINIIHTANALGYGTHWVTRWFSQDKEAAKMLGAKENEKFIAFIHIGTPTKRLDDRDRPDLTDIVSTWQG